MTGAKYIGTELEQIDSSMVQVEAATKGLQDGLKGVTGRMDRQDNRQTQHEQVTSHLHQTIQAEGAAAMGIDEQLGQDLLNTKAQHQRELQNRKRMLNAIMAESEANREARETQETHTAELTEAVTSLMGHVKGMCSNPTLKGRTRAGGEGDGRPPPTMHGVAGGTPDPVHSEREASYDERRGRRDERPDKRNKKLAEKEGNAEEK